MSLLSHIRANAVGYAAILLVVTLAPGSAYAAALMVRSGDIVNGEVKTVDLANDAVRSGKLANGQVLGPDLATDAVSSTKISNGQVLKSDLGSNSVDWSKVTNDSLTGADVLESTLGQVPTALQGGLGRYGFSGSCDPETLDFVPCSVVQIKLDKPARLFVVGTALASAETGVDFFGGSCQIGTTRGPVAASTDFVAGNDNAGDQWESLTVMAVTNVFPAGTHSVGVDCNQQLGQITYGRARVTVVALSAG